MSGLLRPQNVVVDTVFLRRSDRPTIVEGELMGFVAIQGDGLMESVEGRARAVRASFGLYRFRNVRQDSVVSPLNILQRSANLLVILYVTIKNRLFICSAALFYLGMDTRRGFPIGIN